MYFLFSLSCLLALCVCDTSVIALSAIHFTFIVKKKCMNIFKCHMPAHKMSHAVHLAANWVVQLKIDTPDYKN